MNAQPGLMLGATIADAVRALTDAFKAAGIDSANTDARLLVGHALKLDRAQLIAHAGRTLEPTQTAAVQAMAARRLNREPTSRIIGRRAFWTLDLAVTPDVLDPRPDTETLVEAALDFIVTQGLRAERINILDIGTGSGALLLSLLHELPEALGTGTDISEAALAVAKDNAARNGLSARARFVACDLAAALTGPFTLAVSNPPYIAQADIASLDPEVRDFDPVLALSGGHDGLDVYRRIAQDTRRWLAPGGQLIIELGIGQEQAVAAAFRAEGLAPQPARPDLAGIPRALPVGILS